ncbi:VOC family protein [Vibrio genomosp. F10]|uniref:VOC family protein n=1 Tax=Vibrio genomosp. F10 TaxID=723171 RepID=UPI00031C78E6|nr:VOC family protein [Vibrio genomosp. F10]OEE84533.1 glyoxalase [Vibrio genomosp. F10 str. 9ZD137]OEF10081.1 glyoxalase [Vibrio genomosp. F10 str. 9ZB36]
MIGYTTLGTNDIEKSAKFYDSLFAEIDANRIMENDSFIIWSTGPGKPEFAITKPFDGKPASVGNGVMIAIALDTRKKVDELYLKAIELGAQDEGASGLRGGDFYAGYIRDLDGNKLNFFTMAT